MKHLLKIALLFYAISIYSVSFSQNYQISGGSFHTVALNEKGEVYTWGINGTYQLGVDQNLESSNMPLKVSSDVLPPISKVSGGSGLFTLALACDGTVWAWGSNGHGQLGNGMSVDNNSSRCGEGVGGFPGNCDTYIPQQVVGGETGEPFLNNIVAVTGGHNTSYALTADGKVLAWGDNSKSQCVGTEMAVYEPIYIKDENGTPIENVIAISATDYGCYALIDDNGDGAGTVYGWGDNSNQSFQDGLGIIDFPTPIFNEDKQLLDNIVKVSAGDTHGLFLDDNGSLWAVGGVWGGGNQLGTYDGQYDPTSGYASQVLAGEQQTISGYENSHYLENVKDIATGQCHSLALVEYNGERYMMAWGANNPLPWTGGDASGLLGNGTDISAMVPQFVLIDENTKLSSVEAISAGDYMSIAQVYNKETDKIETYTFGGNYFGQLGNGTNTDALFPEKITIPDNSVVQPCPVAYLGGNRVVCSSEMSVRDDVYFELFAGSNGEGYTYEWKCIKDIDGIKTELSEQEISMYTYGDKGQYFKAYFPGTYSVSILYDSEMKEGCYRCADATDEITIELMQPTFTSTPQVFCSTEAEFVVDYPTGKEYAIYLTEDAVEPVEVRKIENEVDGIIFFLNTSDLQRSLYNAEGELYDSDSKFYKAWVEDISTYTATIAENVNTECESGSAYLSDSRISAQRVMVYADKVKVLSVKIDVLADHDAGKTMKPVLLGEKIKYGEFVPDEDILLAEGEAVTITGSGIHEIPINFELEGDAKNGKAYWIGFVPDKSLGLKAYRCNNYPYIDDNKGDVQVLSYADGDNSMLNSMYPTGPGFDWKVAYPSDFPCGRVMVEAQESCYECKAAFPLLSSEEYATSATEDAQVAISLDEDYNGLYHLYDVFVFEGTLDYNDITADDFGSIDFETAVASKLKVEPTTVTYFDFSLSQVGEYTVLVRDANGPHSSACYNLGYFNIVAKQTAFDLSFSLTDGVDAVYPAQVTIDGNVYAADENGKILIKELEMGEYDMVISAEGYYDYTQKVEVVDQAISLDIVLEKIIVVELHEEACTSYDFEGDIIEKSGDYTKVIVDKDGKDNIVNLHLTIYPEYDENATLALPTGHTYQFGTQEITESGSYTETFQSVNGCDSVVHLDITISDDDLPQTSAIMPVCGSYEEDGVIYTENTVFKEISQDSEGNYSMNLTNLIVYPEYDLIDEQTIYEGETFVFDSEELSVAGTYTALLKSKDNCDSLVTLKLSVEPAPYTIKLKEHACGSYEFGDDILTESGDYTKVFTATNGADSTVHLDLWVTLEHDITDEVTIKEGETYLFGTNELSVSGEYTENLYTVRGCDSIVTLTLTVLPKEAIITDLEEVACGSYEFGGDILTESGDYTKVFTAKNGEDSTVNLSLTINPVYNETAEMSIKEGEFYTFGTQELIEAGEYTEVFKSGLGCDSTVTLTLTVLPNEEIVTALKEVACGSYEFGDDILTESGKYTKVFTAKSGADSTVNLTLIINPVYNHTDELTITEGQVYLFGTQELTEAGEYTEVFTSLLGCDSTVVLTLNVTPKSTDTELKIDACVSYEFGDDILTESGEYSKVFTAKDGSDSTVNLSLIINPVYNETAEVSIKEGELFVFGTQELTEAGEYTEVFTSVAGCDSTVTLSVNVLEPFYTEVDTVTCFHFNLDGELITRDGDYTRTYTAGNGADSIVTYHVKIADPKMTDIAVAIHEGDEYLFGSDALGYQTLTESGSYVIYLASYTGCDSIVTLELTVLPKEAIITNVSETACGSYEFGGSKYLSSGTYSKVFTAKNGEDSTVNLLLTINPVYNETAEVSIKEGEMFVFGTQELTVAGEYTEIFTSGLGCDSTVALTLTVLPKEAIVTDLEEVACGSYEFGDDILTESGEYSKVFTAKNGSDSTVNLSLTINPVYNETAELTINEGETYVFGTQELTESGEYTEVFTSGLGCDSTVTLTLLVTPKPIVTELIESVCGFHDFDGDILTISGKYTKVFTAKNGADSIVNLALTINPYYVTTDEITIKEGDTYVFGSQELTKPGEYTESFMSSAGCDSTVTLTLAVGSKEGIVTDLEEVACGSYEFGDDILIESGEYSKVFTAKNGEDSTVNLSLTINPVFNEIAELAINEGEMYVFGTQELTVAGEYTEVFTSVAGCDSTVTLTLAVTAIEPDTEINAGDNLVVSIEENASAGSVIATLPATDTDGNTLTYTISNTEDFEIIDGAIVVKNPDALDAESDEAVVIDVAIETVAGTETAKVTLDITDVDETPELELGEISTPENIEEGTVLATLPEFDEDGNKITYTLSDESAVKIENNTIVVVDPSAFDYETGNVTFELTASDGNNSITETIEIIVENLNDNAPVITLDAKEVSILENLENGSDIVTIIAEDADRDELVYSIEDIETLYWDSENPGTRLKEAVDVFTINPATGELTVADETALDYETVKGFVVTVKVSDGEFSSTEKLTILLSDEDEVAIEASEKTALVYPTIVTDVLSVDVSGNATVTVSTVLGQIVATAEITNSDNINVEKLNKGVYNVEIANKQGLLYKGFVIKK